MWQKLKNVYHLSVAILANLVFFFPARAMKIIAVTGTDGKTTTVNLIYHILKHSGHDAAMISSIGAVIEGKAYDTELHRTTPTSFSLQGFLSKAKKAGTKYFVLETTSHAIDQNRIFGVPIDIAVLTNITNEHLDYHKTYENYLKTKLKLLEKAKIGIVNRDDSSYELLLKEKNISNKWKTYGFSTDSDYNPVVFDIESCRLFGNFNKYNILAAVAVAKNLGIKDKDIISALKTFHKPIGRADYVYEKNFKVMIDFAHTPNAFKQILSALRPSVKGRIIHVFGSAGERDSSKRPEMGKVSAKYADVIILTAEDPRSEDVNQIISEIEAGIVNKRNIIKIPDRGKAIYEAVMIAKKGDLILITGKAQESSMNLGDGEKPWDEFKATENALKNRNLI